MKNSCNAQQHNYNSFVLDDALPGATKNARRDLYKDKPSLEKLMTVASALQTAGDEIARSQLKQLPAKLRHGRRSAEYAVCELPLPIRKVLKDNGLERVWTEEPEKAKATPAHPGSSRWWTTLADVVELYELPQLGRSRALQSPPRISALEAQSTT